MKIIVLVLLFLAAHFSLTPFAPAKTGEARFYWPFAAGTRSWLPWAGGLPSQSGSVLTPLLAGAAGLAFLAAAACLLGWAVPSGWFRPLVGVGLGASGLLYLLYAGPFALLPLALDAFMLWGLLAQRWTPALLNG